MVYHLAVGLTDDEVLAQALIFLLAGYDTTSTALSYLMFDLANNQHWQDRVVEQIDDVIGDQVSHLDNIIHGLINIMFPVWSHNLNL